LNLENIDKDPKDYPIVELLHQLNNNTNPIILYNLFMKIGDTNISDKLIIEKLLEMKVRLDGKDKMLGYYKIGHFAMSVLLKLGLQQDAVFDNNLDEFDKQTVFRLCNENKWL
jgi:hypothetical protein